MPLICEPVNGSDYELILSLPYYICPTFGTFVNVLLKELLKKKGGRMKSMKTGIREGAQRIQGSPSESPSPIPDITAHNGQSTKKKLGVKRNKLSVCVCSRANKPTIF